MENISGKPILYDFSYVHKAKIVRIRFQLPFQPPIIIVMDADSFCKFAERISQVAGGFLNTVKERKGLAIDSFEGEKGDVSFSPTEWERKMEDDKSG